MTRWLSICALTVLALTCFHSILLARRRFGAARHARQSPGLQRRSSALCRVESRFYPWTLSGRWMPSITRSITGIIFCQVSPHRVRKGTSMKPDTGILPWRPSRMIGQSSPGTARTISRSTGPSIKRTGRPSLHRGTPPTGLGPVDKFPRREHPAGITDALHRPGIRGYRASSGGPRSGRRMACHSSVIIQYDTMVNTNDAARCHSMGYTGQSILYSRVGTGIPRPGVPMRPAPPPRPPAWPPWAFCEVLRPSTGLLLYCQWSLVSYGNSWNQAAGRLADLHGFRRSREVGSRQQQRLSRRYRRPRDLLWRRQD